jgi:hypothetical protein
MSEVGRVRSSGDYPGKCWRTSISGRARFADLNRRFMTAALGPWPFGHAQWRHRMLGRGVDCGARCRVQRRCGRPGGRPGRPESRRENLPDLAAVFAANRLFAACVSPSVNSLSTKSGRTNSIIGRPAVVCSKAHLRVAWVPDARGFVPNCDALTTPGGGLGSGRIDQGVDMGRPSLLLGRTEKRGGVVGAVHIGGHAVPVMRGAFDP